MRLFGALTELEKITLRADLFALDIIPNASTTYTAARTVSLPPTDADEELVGKAATQTLTNKTIAAGSNTITGLTNTNLDAGAAIALTKLAALTVNKAVYTNASGNIVASSNVSSTEVEYLDGLTGNIQTQLDDHEDAFTGVHGVSGDIVGTTDSQVLTNKTLTDSTTFFADNFDGTKKFQFQAQGITAGATRTITVPDADVTIADATTLSNHTADTDIHFTQDEISIPASQISDFDTEVSNNADVAANTAKVSADGSINTHSDVDTSTASPATGDALVWDGTNWVPGEVSGSGTGAKNYVSDRLSDWSAHVGDLTEETTAANLPREHTSPVGLSFTSTSTDSWAETRFTLDDADLTAANLLLKLSAVVADASTWEPQLYAYANSDYSDATPEKVRLVDADSSGNWYLPVGSLDSKTYWTPIAGKPYMQLRVATSTNGAAITWSDTLVGPGDATSGANVGPVVDYKSSASTPTGLGAGSGTWQYYNYNEDGEYLYIDCYFQKDSTAGSGSNPVEFPLPSGYTYAVDESVLKSGAGNTLDLTSTSNNYETHAVLIVSNKFRMLKNGGGGYVNGVDVLANTNMRFSFRVRADSLVGKGTVGRGTNRVEYAHSTNTTTTAGDTQTDDGEYGYGPGGTDFVAIASTTAGSNTSKRVRFQTPFQPTDVPLLQVQLSGQTWVNVADSFLKQTRQGSSLYGMDVERVSGSDTDVLVRFGNKGAYASGAAFGDSGAAWSSVASGGYKWRVVKHSAGVVTGYGQATADVKGLVNYDYQELDISSSGSFSAGNSVLRLSRVNQQVTLTWTGLTHTSSSTPASASGFIPEGFRPTANVTSVTSMASTELSNTQVSSAGVLSFEYRDFAGAAFARTSTRSGTMSWTIDG